MPRPRSADLRRTTAAGDQWIVAGEQPTLSIGVAMVIVVHRALLPQRADKPTLGNRGRGEPVLRGQQGPQALLTLSSTQNVPSIHHGLGCMLGTDGSDAIKCEGCSWDYKFVKKRG